MDVPAYRVIDSDDPEELEAKINELDAAGYQPQVFQFHADRITRVIFGHRRAIFQQQLQMQLMSQAATDAAFAQAAEDEDDDRPQNIIQLPE